MKTSTRRIPKVGTAVLVLGGCSSDEIRGSGDIAERFCSMGFECDPAEFSYDYTSRQQCTVEITALLDYYEDYYASLYGEACGRAFTHYYECWAGAITGCDSTGYDLFAYDEARLDRCYSEFYSDCPTL